MSSSLVITLKMGRASGDLTRFIKDTSNPRNECRSLAHLFERLGAGLEAASFDVQTSANAPVKASTTLTLTFASISNNDTCVVAGVTLTCVTGTPSGAQFKKVTDATTTAANLVALINSNTTTSKLVKAANALGVVTISALIPGAIGNFITLVGSTGMVAGAATLGSGAGGAETVAVNFSRGL